MGHPNRIFPIGAVMTAKLGNSRVWWRINFREGGSDVSVGATVQGLPPPQNRFAVLTRPPGAGSP
jgi:hypothetical protein